MYHFYVCIFLIVSIGGYDGLTARNAQVLVESLMNHSHIAGKHVVLHASPEGVTISEVPAGTHAPHADKSAEEQEKVASSQRPVMPSTSRMVSSLILAFTIWSTP